MEIRKRTGDKVIEHYCSKDAFKLFKKEYPGNKIKSSEFYKIIEEFNQEVVHKMIYEAFKFQMPGRLSSIWVRKRKTKLKLDKKDKLDTTHLHIDYAATKQLWKEDEEARNQKKVIFHLNEHFEGFYSRFFWNKFKCSIRNKQVYEFSPCRFAQRALAAGIKTGKVDFYA